MRRELPEVERDSLLEFGTLQDSESKVYLTGRHHIYKWNGYRFIKYTFPKDDRIKLSKFVNSKLLAIGNNGYGVLDSDQWTYYRISIKDYTDSNFYAAVITENSVFSYTVMDCTLDSDNRLFEMHYQKNFSLKDDIMPKQTLSPFVISVYSAKGKFVIPLFSAHEIENLFSSKGIQMEPEFKTTAGWGTYLTFNGTDLVFRFDGTKQRFLIQKIITGKQLSTSSNRYLAHNRIVYTRSDTLFVHDLDHGIDYYQGDHFYYPTAPNTTYLIYTEKGLIGVDYKTAKGSNLIFPRQVLKEVSGLQYLNPVDTQALNPPVRSSMAKDYPSYWNDGKYLAYSVAQSSVKGTHRLYLINLAAGTRKEIEVADEAESLQILDYNEVSNYLTIAGKDGIRLVSLSLPSYLDYGLKESEQYTFSEVKESILGKLVLLRRESDINLSSFLTEVKR
jgi:hypothetical protein